MQSHTRPSRARTTFLVALLIASSIYSNVALIKVAQSVRMAWKSHNPIRSPLKPLGSYSFIGSDHPEHLPIPRRAVRMTVEESVHYDISQPEAEMEWLYTAPLGDNDVRLGPERRLFAVAMFHELHCLRGIREALDGGLASLPALLQGHVNHCFNYLRQWTLCGADVTLEPGDFAQRNFTTQRTGATHTCPDWEPVYEMVGANWFEWERFREANGLLPFVDNGLD
ncbi:hypothetical protein JB92DRAFT_3090881 [Gautieria morchelliformis]|nr:hypothetical protein JB92DRAFT_3090881 [Gautieria morchelliformis]